MRQTNGTGRRSSEKVVKDIKRATRKQYSSEEKIRIPLNPQAALEISNDFRRFKFKR